jgi:hypothetical protein
MSNQNNPSKCLLKRIGTKVIDKHLGKVNVFVHLA